MKRLFLSLILLSFPLSSFAAEAQGGTPPSGGGVPPGMVFLRVNEQGCREYLNEKDGSTLILIPAGEFSMGSDDYGDFKPAHTVSLDPCYIGKYAVTVSQYRKFTAATGYLSNDEKNGSAYVKKGSHWLPEAGANWSNPGFSQGDYHPVVCVSWEDAKAYCDWAGLRLPTEAEWEKAARGTDGRKYPWGGSWDPSRCNNGEDDSPDGYDRTAPVGSFPKGASPYGAMDMAGNVWQWCADWYDADYYKQSPNSNPPGPISGKTRVLRGGGWSSSHYGCSTMERLGDIPHFGLDPQARGDDTYGFRVAR